MEQSLFSCSNKNIITCQKKKKICDTNLFIFNLYIAHWHRADLCRGGP